jgi:membrane protein DedA with SNARE-associated domain
MLFNALGGLAWAALFGWAGFTFGKEVETVTTSLAILSVTVAVLGFLLGMWFLRRHELSLEQQAERAHPGPLRVP